MNPKVTNRQRKHTKIRRRLSGTAKRPRLVVYRSLKTTYAQLIDDKKNTVIAATSDLKLKEPKTGVERAKQVGLNIAKIASEKKIKECVFDRAGYKYHGKVKAIAEGAREGGLKF